MSGPLSRLKMRDADVVDPPSWTYFDDRCADEVTPLTGERFTAVYYDLVDGGGDLEARELITGLGMGQTQPQY